MRSAFFAFAVTRAIVFGSLVLAANVPLAERSPQCDFVEASIYVQQDALLRWLAQAVTTGDAGWYLAIARHGYDKEPFEASRQHNWAFFPLYPLIVRTVAKLTGEYRLTAALLSNIFFFTALVFMHKTALQFGADESAADLAVFYLAAFPTAYFFSFPFTESLFLVLSISTFFFAKRERWWLAGAFGALASATRLTGLFLLLPVAVLYFQTYRLQVRTHVLALGLIPTGLIAYMLYLHWITGNALAFYEIQSAWGREPSFFLQPLWSYLKNPWLLAAPWNFRLLNFAAAVLAFACIAVLLKRRQWALGAYTIISLIVPLSTSLSMQSLTRYIGTVFPIFLVLGQAGHSRTLDRVITMVFVVLLGLLTAMYALRITMAMS